MAVYITSAEEWLVLNIFVNVMRKCHPAFRTNVAIQMVVPKSLDSLNVGETSYNISLKSGEFLNASCMEAKELIDLLSQRFLPKDQAGTVEKLYYPQNQMRNTARKVSVQCYNANELNYFVKNS